MLILESEGVVIAHLVPQQRALDIILLFNPQNHLSGSYGDHSVLQMTLQI